MSTAGEAEKAVVVEKQQTEAPVAAEKSAKSKKKAKVPKPKSAKTASHPPYFQMIKEALVSLKDRTGSSPQAIAKSIEEKYKSALPSTFRKVLGLQLKNLSSKGKLVKIKASYKLSDAGKKVDAVKKPAVANATAAKPVKKAVQAKKNVEAKPETKKAAVVEKKKKKAVAAAAAAKPVKKVAQTKKRAAPGGATKAKQPKSIKSPAGKKAKKGAAA